MNIFRYIQALLEAEYRLMENFIKIAEYYKTEPGVYYGCQEMASVSSDHVKEIRRESEKFRQLEGGEGHFKTMIKDHDLGMDLLMDLQYMWLLTMESAMLNNILLQAARNNSENDLELMCRNFDFETEKQSQWLLYRINMSRSVVEA